jgi:hypothetical protein
MPGQFWNSREDHGKSTYLGSGIPAASTKCRVTDAGSKKGSGNAGVVRGSEKVQKASAEARLHVPNSMPVCSVSGAWHPGMSLVLSALGS